MKDSTHNIYESILLDINFEVERISAVLKLCLLTI